METTGTAILLKIQPAEGADLALIVDFQEKKVSLVEVEGGRLHVKEVHEYLKPAYIKPRRKRK